MRRGDWVVIVSVWLLAFTVIAVTVAYQVTDRSPAWISVIHDGYEHGYADGVAVCGIH